MVGASLSSIGASGGTRCGRATDVRPAVRRGQEGGAGRVTPVHLSEELPHNLGSISCWKCTNTSSEQQKLVQYFGVVINVYWKRKQCLMHIFSLFFYET
jgi:hypothetical protein